jgi:hypothetical protein
MDFNIHFSLFSLTRTITIKKQWIRFLVITTVLFASAIVSFWGGFKIFILIVILLLGILIFTFLLKQPNLGFLLLLVGGMFIPFTGPSGLNASTIILAFMLGLWILDMLVVKKQFVFIRSQVMTPILAFFLVTILAFGMGQIPWFVFARQAPLPAQLGGFAIFTFSIGTILLSGYLIKELRWLQIIVWTFIVLGGVYVLARAIDLPLIDRVYNKGFSAGSMFWTWLVALTASQVIYNDKLQTRIRVLLIGIVLLTLYVAVYQGYDWKSGWFPPLISLAVIIGSRYRKLVLLAVPVGAMTSLYLVSKLISSDSYSWGTRVDAWRIILEISRVSPILGMGYANYYWYTPLFPIRGWRVSFNSHSQYIDLIAQTGYIGLICFLWLFFAVGRLSWSLANKLQNGFARGYSYGVFAGIIGSLVAAFLVDWVLPFVYNIGLTGFRASILPWLFMGGVIAIEQMQLQNTKL